MNPIPVPVATVGLLVLSNVFMTFAWYGHLKFKSSPLISMILISWSIARSSRSPISANRSARITLRVSR